MVLEGDCGQAEDQGRGRMDMDTVRGKAENVEANSPFLRFGAARGEGVCGKLKLAKPQGGEEGGTG